MPEMIVVSSSNVSAVGYEVDYQITYIEFMNGTLYTYKGVPESEFLALLTAPSIGSYLHRNFKNNYPYERIR